MPNNPEVQALRYDYLLKLTNQPMFDEVRDHEVRNTLSNILESIQTEPGSLAYKCEAHQLFEEHRSQNNDSFSELLAYIDISIPKNSSIEYAQARFDECMEDIESDDEDEDDYLSPKL